MSVNFKDRQIPLTERTLYYTAESLSFVRNVLSDLEHELKEKAKQLTREAGRDTITEEDMRQATDDILGPIGDEADDSDQDHA